MWGYTRERELVERPHNQSEGNDVTFKGPKWLDRMLTC